MVSWKMKSCPRCNGDTFIARDEDGWYEQCLQCSHRRDLKAIAQPSELVESGRKRRRR